MKTLSAKDAKYGFGRLIDLACGEPVAFARHGRNGRIMDQAIYNGIVSNTRDIEDNPDSRPRFAMSGRTHSADPNRQ